MIKLSTPKKNKITLPALFMAITFFASLHALAQTPTIVFVPVVSSLNQPCDVVSTHEANKLYVAQLDGFVKVVTLPSGPVLAGNFIDLTDSTDNAGEGGLLSIAFHPGFDGTTNRYFFVYYTTNQGNLRLTRFQTVMGNPNLADQTTGTVLMTIPHPTNSNHNGAKLNFGPDGNLYFGTGDGGGGDDPGNNAQNGNSLLGKMIRINVDDFLTPPYYTIPADNPYVGDPAVRDEIYNIGMRNPWRWSFDRETGDVWIADVGQGAKEEVNFTTFATSGGVNRNYGWRCYEGSDVHDISLCLPISNYFFPIFEYDHGLGSVITGGYVYRGRDYYVMYGYYICLDFSSRRLWVIKPDGVGGWISSVQAPGSTPSSIAGFGEASNGALYAVSLNGTLYKVTSSTPYLPLTLLQFSAKAYNGFNELRWKTTNEQNLAYYEIEYSSDGINYTSAGKVNAANTVTENNYSLKHYISSFTKLFYKLKSVGKDNLITYSDVVKLDNTGKPNIQVYPTLVKKNRLTIISEKAVEQVSIISVDGRIAYQEKLNSASGTINIPIPHLQNGFYFVQVKLKDGYFNEKILIQQE